MGSNVNYSLCTFSGYIIPICWSILWWCSGSLWRSCYCKWSLCCPACSFITFSFLLLVLDVLYPLWTLCWTMLFSTGTFLGLFFCACVRLAFCIGSHAYLLRQHPATLLLIYRCIQHSSCQILLCYWSIPAVVFTFHSCISTSLSSSWVQRLVLFCRSSTYVLPLVVRIIVSYLVL